MIGDVIKLAVKFVDNESEGMIRRVFLMEDESSERDCRRFEVMNETKMSFVGARFRVLD